MRRSLVAGLPREPDTRGDRALELVQMGLTGIGNSQDQLRLTRSEDMSNRLIASAGSPAVA